MENIQWEGLSASGEIEMDICDIACDVDRLIAAALKLYQFPQNL
jgi:hypothetical protein